MSDETKPAEPGDEQKRTHPTDSDKVKAGVQEREDDERQTATPPPYSH